MIDSIAARHNHEQAEQRRLSRELIADAGPTLANDDATLVIPSPTYHKEFCRILRAHGFHYEHGLCPWWERAIDVPLSGKTYTAAQWLDWAIRRYTWAWPEWENGRVSDG